MAPGMEVASSSNPATSDPLSPHATARSPVNSSSASWYPPPPPSVSDPRYASTAHVDHMMMPGATSLHRGASPPPTASGGGGALPLDPQQHTSAATYLESAAEASRYYQMHQAYENAATQGRYIFIMFL